MPRPYRAGTYTEGNELVSLLQSASVRDNRDSLSQVSELSPSRSITDRHCINTVGEKGSGVRRPAGDRCGAGCLLSSARRNVAVVATPRAAPRREESLMHTGTLTRLLAATVVSAAALALAAAPASAAIRGGAQAALQAQVQGVCLDTTNSRANNTNVRLLPGSPEPAVGHPGRSHRRGGHRRQRTGGVPGRDQQPGQQHERPSVVLPGSPEPAVGRPGRPHRRRGLPEALT